MPHTREELISFVDRFLDAVSHNDPSRLSLAPNVRYTENCQDVPVGKGLWANGTPHPIQKHFLDIVEPAAGQVAYFGVVHEGGRPSVLSVRMRVEEGLVHEIEVLVARNPEESGQPRVFSPENMVEPKPVFDAIVPPGQRTSREDLLRIPHLYLDGILSSNGDMIPVLDECIRVENGTQTVLNAGRGSPAGALGVRAQVNTGVFKDIEAASDRRIPIVDEERGLVFAIFLFDHPGPVTNAPYPTRYTQPNSMMVAEVFKVVAGTIHQIEAVLNVFPYYTRSGWA
jgi:hypothetical protein